jgi:hypothetical protein
MWAQTDIPRRYDMWAQTSPPATRSDMWVQTSPPATRSDMGVQITFDKAYIYLKQAELQSVSLLSVILIEFFMRRYVRG